MRALDRRATARLGIDGLVFTVVGGQADKAATTVDYSSFADAYSGSWSSRLRVVRLPECALTTPEGEHVSHANFAPNRFTHLQSNRLDG